MTQLRALAEMERFLSSGDPEVISVSGRWGVGKTYAWDMALAAKRANAPLRSYAYVSVFGLRSLDSLKTAIVQSTVSLDGEELEPTVESFVAHISSFAGIRKMGGETARKSLTFFSKGAAAIPYVGKMADLLAPGASLLIRNQIICIDDIERAGQGLDVTDILGLVSSLRERRNCKVVLLLNEDGLGDQKTKYREYLEKVVDQAIEFQPTPEESAAAALGTTSAITTALRARTVALGITNIRVIRRIWRFLSHIEPQLAGLHEGVAGRVVQSIALLGWSVFEPQLAPNMERIQRYNLVSGMFGEDARSTEDKGVDRFLHAYGFGQFGDVDAIILSGLKDGAFDAAALRATLEIMDRGFAKNEARYAIFKPWTILEDSFADNEGAFLDALVESVEKHASDMAPQEASDALAFLRELGRPEEAERLLPLYVAAQTDRPREFFATQYNGYRRPLDPAIAEAFEQKLADLPLVRDTAQILVGIGTKNTWNPADVAYLATVPVDVYEAMLRSLSGTDLNAVIVGALRFGEIHGSDGADLEVCNRMTAALRRIANDGTLNRMRVAPYLRNDPAAPEEA